MLSVLHSCPDPNRHTFLYLMQHLQRLDKHHTPEILNKTIDFIALSIAQNIHINPLHQSLGEAARQQDVADELGNNIRSQPFTPPCGWTGA